jgi:hypothetical protein
MVVHFTPGAHAGVKSAVKILQSCKIEEMDIWSPVLTPRYKKSGYKPLFKQLLHYR